MKELTRMIDSFFKAEKLFGQLIIQLCDHCNAKCPQCMMNKNVDYQREVLSRQKLFEIIDIAAASKIKAISLTGGEPLLFEDLLFEGLAYAHSKNIKYTRTGTNGFIFQNPNRKNFEKRVNALCEKIVSSHLYTFWISLDSYDIKKHEKNRGLSGVVGGIKEALKIFKKYDLYPSVNLGINRLIEDENITYVKNEKFYPELFFECYKSGFKRFFDFCIELGFTIANMCYPMSNKDAVYKAESKSDLVSYSNEELVIVFKALKEVIKEYRKKIRIFTPISSLQILIDQYSGEDIGDFCCLGGKDYFFVNNKGNLYPCGFKSGMKYDNLNVLKGKNKNLNCTDCDWECFRDPSTLSAPIYSLRKRPVTLITNLFKKSSFYRLWIEDLLYYKKCNFFNMQKRFDGLTNWRPLHNG